MAIMLGIDIGTTNTKVLALDEQGRIAALSSLPNRLYQDTAAMAEEDPEELYQTVLKGIQQVVQSGRFAAKDIVGLSFSAAMHSLIAMDANGKPLTRAITWADYRAAAYARQLKDDPYSDQLYQSTGTPIHPMTPLSKLIWIRREHPDVFQKAAKFIGIKGYILYRLFGVYVTDKSVANATGLWNIHTQDWDAKALDIAHVTAARLPKLVDTTYQLHGLSQTVAAQLGLDAQIPFVIGASDGPLSNLGVNAIGKGDFAVTIGTSGAVRSMSNRPLTDPKGRLFCYYLLDGLWVIGGPSNNGGNALSWTVDHLFSAEKKTAAGDHQNPYQIVTDFAGQVPAGAHGLLFLPYLHGERAPLWNAAARGTFFGLTALNTRADMARAVLEGVLFNLNEITHEIEQLVGQPNIIKASGGFAKSPLWRQMLADIFAETITFPDSPESSAFGAALLGFYSLGILKDFSQLDQLIGVTRRLTPQVKNKATYQELNGLWLEINHALAPHYEGLARFQQEHYK
ncbi:gluconokinase [Lactobacillus selangorensis]|uniref:Gluconokinase n=1 Tax=Lactobacillus selangorensis TaxID=81857 RepID=A0A0R2FTV3_9LACO|nr:FGGY family carbohydrate kinase [Lactobacillus selangorensis]KRN28321.1 gluconokinase [Lactobacillus selangorensis]KRN31823.1 gluconokinase [Lactobacillus selangorensis]